MFPLVGNEPIRQRIVVECPAIVRPIVQIPSSFRRMNHYFAEGQTFRRKFSNFRRRFIFFYDFKIVSIFVVVIRSIIVVFESTQINVFFSFSNIGTFSNTGTCVNDCRNSKMSKFPQFFFGDFPVLFFKISISKSSFEKRIEKFQNNSSFGLLLKLSLILKIC